MAGIPYIDDKNLHLLEFDDNDLTPAKLLENLDKKITDKLDDDDKTSLRDPHGQRSLPKGEFNRYSSQFLKKTNSRTTSPSPNHSDTDDEKTFAYTPIPISHTFSSNVDAYLQIVSHPKFKKNYYQLYFSPLPDLLSSKFTVHNTFIVKNFRYECPFIIHKLRKYKIIERENNISPTIRFFSVNNLDKLVSTCQFAIDTINTKYNT